MTTATVRYDSSTKHRNLVPSDIVLCDIVYKQNSRYNKPYLINFERANIVCTHFSIMHRSYNTIRTYILPTYRVQFKSTTCVAE